MSVLLLRSLFAACSLVLALPPGWCCLLPARQVDTTIEQPTIACCREPAAQPKRTCCHSGGDEHPNPPAEQAPPLTTCCCSPVDSALPSNIDAYQPDLAASMPLLAADVDRPVVWGDGEIVVRCPSQAQSLHLLQCVWLC